MATEERDCAAEWEWRFTHDECLIQEWQAAIDEVKRFNAEEAKRKQREAELAEGEEEAPSIMSHSPRSITRPLGSPGLGACERRKDRRPGQVRAHLHTPPSA